MEKLVAFGPSMGVVASRSPFIPLPGVCVYNPVYGLVDNKMDDQFLVNSLNYNPKKAMISYQVLREVTIDDKPFWRNMNDFPENELQMNPKPAELLAGYGDVLLHFRDHERSKDWLEAIVAKQIGFVAGDDRKTPVQAVGRAVSTNVDPNWDVLYQASVTLHDQNTPKVKIIKKLDELAQPHGAYSKDDTVPIDPHVHYAFKELRGALGFGLSVYRDNVPARVNVIKARFDREQNTIFAEDFSSRDFRDIMTMMETMKGQKRTLSELLGGKTLLSAGLTAMPLFYRAAETVKVRLG